MKIFLETVHIQNRKIVLFQILIRNCEVPHFWKIFYSNRNIARELTVIYVQGL